MSYRIKQSNLLFFRGHLQAGEGYMEEDLPEQAREPGPLYAGHPGGARPLREGLPQ